MHILCPHCKNPIELVRLTPSEEITCEACGSSFHLETSSTTGHSGGAPETLGRFELLGALGQGAFGTVYRARDPQLDRVVAVKVPRHDNVGPREEDRDRFLREARSAAQLRHPSIVAVHEVGVAGTVTYLVSDFVEGVTLADRLTAGRPSVRESAAIVAAVAEALQYAHAQGVVHRDVKPSNIMLRPDGTPVVMDFGLAKRDAGEITMTVDGQVLGTPAYMPPEQARGEGHGVDGRSDVYSLGVILYQLLTGELPFRGNTRMLLHQVLHDDPKPPRALNDRLPRDLETVCLKAMAKEPGRRYATAGELAADLRRHLAGEPVLARRAGRVERAVRWARRKPAEAAAAGLGLLALAAATAAGVGLAYSWRLAAAYQKEVEAHEEAEDARAGEQQQRKAAEGAREREASARKVAEVAEGKARDALKKMERAEYFNNILIAGTAVKEGRDRDAPLALGACRPELRGWEWYELQAACHREHLVVKGEVHAFCPTREEVACAEADGTIHVWDLVSGREVGRAPLRAGGKVLAMGYSQDGRRLTAGGQGGLRVWEMNGGQELWKADGASGVAFSPDGRWLAAATNTGATRVLEAGTGRQRWQAEQGGVGGGPARVAFSPDGRRLAVAGGRAGMRVLEADTGRELWKPTSPNLRLVGYLSVAFSPDGRRLAAGGFGEARVWEADGGRELWRADGTYFGVAFSPDGQRLATGGTNSVRVWEAGAGRLLWEADGDYRGVTYSPDGRRLAGVGLREVRVWETEGGRDAWRFEGSHDGVAFSPDGRRLAAQGRGEVRVWEAGGGRTLWEGYGAYDHLAFGPGGKRLAVLEGRGVRVWEVDDGREMWKSDGRFSSVAFSPDGRLLAAGGAAGLRVWDAATGRVLWQAGGNFHHLVFSSDGKRLAAGRWLAKKDADLAPGSDRDGVRVWDVGGGRLLWQADGPYTNLAFNCLEFSPDGRCLASAGGPGGLRMWDADTGGEVWKAEGSHYGVVFSPDGKRLATFGGRAVRVLEASGGRELWKDDWDGLDMSFSPDGRRLAAGGGKDGVRVCEADTGRELWQAEKGNRLATYRGAGFSPDGKRLATNGGGGVRVWDADGGRELWRLDGTYSGVAFSPDGRRLAVRGGNLAETQAGRHPVGGLRLFGGPEDVKDLMAARRQAIHHTRSEHHRSLASQSEAAHQWLVAAFHWEQLARAEPARGEPHYRRGLALARLARTSDAEQEFLAALESRTPLAPRDLADCHAMLGRFPEAAKLYQELTAPPALRSEALYRSALLRLGAGDAGGYRSECKALIHQLGKEKTPGAANNIAACCALGPDALADLKPAVDLARQAVKSAPKSWECRDTLGAVLYRAGQHAEAVAEFEAAIRMQDKGGEPLTLFFLAMAQHRIGKTDEARKLLEQAVKFLDQDPAWFWTEKLERQLLRREAEALLRAPAKKAG